MWVHVGSGETLRGHGWENYPIGASDADSRGVTMWVDTKSAKFSGTPRYFTSIGGKSHHWSLTGVTSIYDANKDGFRVYVHWADGSKLNAQTAAQMQWYINWFGLEDEACRGGGPIVL